MKALLSLQAMKRARRKRGKGFFLPPVPQIPFYRITYFNNESTCKKKIYFKLFVDSVCKSLKGSLSLSTDPM